MIPIPILVHIHPSPKNRLVHGKRIPRAPAVVFASVVMRHPHRPMVLVRPEGAIGGVWIDEADVLG